jgi:S-layer homology domain
MKKNSTSHSAFFNARVLFGLFVMLAGVFLALVSFGSFSSVFAQNGTTREKMALELAQALNIQPPACVAGQEMFNDVPASNPFCPFIEELVRRGITGGCGGGNYCPSASVTRAQMAAFLIKTLGAATDSEAFHIVGTAGQPPFQNGWHNIGLGFSTAGFFKDPLGIVHLKGTLSGGVSGNPAFTLPGGYRPAEFLFLPIAGGGTGSGLVVLQDGRVQPACGGACSGIGLDGLTFRVP